MAFRRKTASAPADQEPLDRKSALKSALRLLARYGKPYIGEFLLAVVCLVVAGSLALMFPYYVGLLVDSAFTNRDRAKLDATLLFLVGLLTVQSVFSFGRTFLINYIGERFIADLREDLYAHLLRLSVTFFSNRRVGELVSRASSDATLIQTAMTSNLAEGLRQTIVLAGGVTLMFVTNYKLSLSLVGIIPFLVAGAALFGGVIRRVSTRIQDRLGEASAVLDETLSNIRIVQSFVREGYEIDRYRRHVRAAVKEARNRSLARGGFNAFILFILFNGIVLLLWFSCRQVIDGHMTVGQVTTFFLYTSVVGTALGAFTELSAEFNQMLGSSRRVVELFEAVPDIVETAGAAAWDDVRGGVEFREVVFSYPGREEKVLDGINLSVRPGEMVALVGPSGAGKSTLVSLIPRFFDVSHGTIRVDGLDVRSIRLRDLREHVGIVPQETALFSGTVRENVAYGNLMANNEEIERAAQAANAHDFIVALPDGYDTAVGERGVKLSGGQRQRIAIARAVLKNPRILILDEATSSLDSESEELVQNALEHLMEGRTALVIAHRLSTVRRADRIIVLDRGKIVEEGTHQALLDLGGLYKRLHDLQFRDGSAPS